MFVKFHRINTHANGSYYLTEVRLNISHISYISENLDMRGKLKEGKLNLDLHPATLFTNITVSFARDTQNIIVVGDPDLIESKMNKPYRQLLRG
tara:strand:+ start:550 stop:831 length:282 start_codon:yes stop_codon:yes gene_type:complete